jgi:hypothetical protein
VGTEIGNKMRSWFRSRLGCFRKGEVVRKERGIYLVLNNHPLLLLNSFSSIRLHTVSLYIAFLIEMPRK